MNRLSVLSLIAFSSLFLVACTAMNEDKTEVNDEVTVDVATPKYDYFIEDFKKEINKTITIPYTINTLELLFAFIE